MKLGFNLLFIMIFLVPKSFSQSKKFVDKSDWPLDSLRQEMEREGFRDYDIEFLVEEVRKFRKNDQNKFFPSRGVGSRYLEHIAYLDGIKRVRIYDYGYKAIPEKDRRGSRFLKEQHFKKICHYLQDEEIEYLSVEHRYIYSKEMFDCQCYETVDSFILNTHESTFPDFQTLQTDSTKFKFLRRFKNLKYFDYTGYYPSAFPKEFGNLKKLQELILNVESLSYLPKTIKNLVNLEKFWCFYWKSENFPNSILALNQIRNFFFISQASIKSIKPDAFTDFHKLERFGLKNLGKIKGLQSDVLRNKPNLKQVAFDNVKINNPWKIDLYPGNFNFKVINRHEVKDIPNWPGMFRAIAFTNSFRLDIKNTNLSKLKLFLNNNKEEDPAHYDIVGFSPDLRKLTIKTKNNVTIPVKLNFNDYRIKNTSIPNKLVADSTVNFTKIRFDDKVKPRKILGDLGSVHVDTIKMHTKPFNTWWGLFWKNKIQNITSLKTFTLKEQCAPEGSCAYEMNENGVPEITYECQHEDPDYKKVKKVKNALPNNASLDWRGPCRSDSLYNYEINKPQLR